MRDQKKLRVLLPVMLVGFLCFGVAAEARQDQGDRVAKGAVIGAAVGTLLQLAQGRNEGHEILTGAVVGGAFGAIAGAASEGRRDRYYDRDGYYGYRGGEYYPSQGYSYQGEYDGRYYSAPRSTGRYDRYDRYDRDERYDRDGRYDRECRGRDSRDRREDSRYRRH